jgi:hypothetical protein
VECKYHIHNNPPLIPNLSQINPAYLCLMFSLIIFSNLRLGLSNDLLSLVPSTKVLYEFNPQLLYPVAWLPHLFDDQNSMWWRIQAVNSLIMYFPRDSCCFIPLRSRYSPHYQVLEHHQSMIFFQYETPWSTLKQNIRWLLMLCFRETVVKCRCGNNSLY